MAICSSSLVFSQNHSSELVSDPVSPRNFSGSLETGLSVIVFATFLISLGLTLSVAFLPPSLILLLPFFYPQDSDFIQQIIYSEFLFLEILINRNYVTIISGNSFESLKISLGWIGNRDLGVGTGIAEIAYIDIR